MKTYTVILHITSKYGDPATWDWPTLLDIEHVRVEHTHSNTPVRKYQSRDAERDSIISTLNAMQRPMTTAAIAKLAGLTPALAARLVYELKHKKRLREAGRDSDGHMLYEVA